MRIPWYDCTAGKIGHWIPGKGGCRRFLRTDVLVFFRWVCRKEQRIRKWTS